LFLAGLGLYGVMAYSVTSRTKEIGIRMALGAARRRVVGHILAESSRFVLAGLVIGAVLSWATARLFATALFGVTPADPMTLSLAVLTTIGVTAVAASLPARRAARVEPIVALRHD
jgi:ABC-type antimicrobial peptide transport system permease subunit